MFHIVNNAPGTASPIPGLLAPFAFNAPGTVVISLAFAAAGGLLAGFIGGTVFKRIREKKGILVKEIIAETTEAVESEEALEPSV